MKLLRLPVRELRSGPLHLAEADARYVTRVHRLRAGDRLELFDPQARTRAEAELRRVDGAEVELEVLDVLPGEVLAERVVRVVQCLPKGDKLDAIVRDATELGASELWLCQSARTITKLDQERAAGKLQRLERVAEQAARQCGRHDVPRLVAPRPLLACLQDDNADLRLLLTPHASAAAAAPLRALGAGASVSLYVGPEGGFAPEESQAALEHGALPVHLGAFVLRTETVVAAVLGALRLLEG